MEEVKTKVRSFLSRYFRKHELTDDDDIFSLGFVNSLFALQLVMFVEKEFKIKIDNQDLHINNFRTINYIDNLVKSKITNI